MDHPVLMVTDAQVEAARLLVELGSADGEQVDDAIKAIAAAQPAPGTAGSDRPALTDTGITEALPPTSRASMRARRIAGQPNVTASGDAEPTPAERRGGEINGAERQAFVAGYFPLVERGYDRRAVDEYVRSLEASVVESRRYVASLEKALAERGAVGRPGGGQGER